MMTNSCENLARPLTWLTAVLLAVAAGSALAEWPPQSFEAHYEVLMDGKKRLETRVRFERDDDEWQIESSSKGTGGMARFLGVETTESAAGTLEDGRVVTRTFSHKAEVAVSKKQWSADFDWPSGIVRTVHEDGESVVALEPGTIDPLGLSLQLQSLLQQGGNDWVLPVLDESEIDREHYAAREPEFLQSPLGCLEAVEIRRIREDGKRYSIMWFAPDLDFVLVRMVHGKRGGHEFDMRITRLILNGTSANRRENCE